MLQTDYMHHVPGRLRIRSRRLCGFAKSRNVVLRELRALEGVRDCLLNVKAGCVTVFYDTETTSVDPILKLLKERKVLESPALANNRVKTVSKTTKMGSKNTANAKVLNLTSMVSKAALSVLINKGVSLSISSLLGARV